MMMGSDWATSTSPKIKKYYLIPEKKCDVVEWHILCELDIFMQQRQCHSTMPTFQWSRLKKTCVK